MLLVLKYYYRKEMEKKKKNEVLYILLVHLSTIFFHVIAVDTHTKMTILCLWSLLKMSLF